MNKRWKVLRFIALASMAVFFVASVIGVGFVNAVIVWLAAFGLLVVTLFIGWRIGIKP